MHVLYFHQHFSTVQGSTGTRSYSFARRLIERGHQVTMICGSSSAAKTGLSGNYRRGQREGHVDGIHVIELDLPYRNHDGLMKRSWTFARYALRAINLALFQEADLVFATSTPLTAGIPGVVASLFCRRPFVFEVRDLWPELPRAMGVIRNPVVLKAMELLEWISYRCADGCIGLSPGIVEGIARRGVPLNHISLVPNGCDLGLFSGRAEGAWRPEEVAKGDLLAAFTGAHGTANGLDAVLDAAAELKRRRRTTIKIVLVGDGMRKANLMGRAAQEALDNVIFLDPIPKHRLAGLMASTDVGLMVLANVPAFYYGTSPNKFFDYIASGLPVVNNYPGWLAELITQHRCGIAVPANDPAAFADALERLADSPQMRHEMGQNARRLAESQFDRRSLADEWVDCLEIVMQRARSSPQRAR